MVPVVKLVVAIALGLGLTPVAVAVAAAPTAYPDPPTIVPASGPPGTMVTVSNLAPCDNGTAEFDTQSTPAATYGRSGVFNITVPEIANGDHFIFVNCNGSFGGVRFTVAGSPVQLQPTLTA
jgi:hypothetical protein